MGDYPYRFTYRSSAARSTSTPDTSRTESAARDAAWLAGRVEDFGGGVGVPPVTTPYCSVCQRGTSGYVCGPCARDAECTCVDDECLNPGARGCYFGEAS